MNTSNHFQLGIKYNLIKISLKCHNNFIQKPMKITQKLKQFSKKSISCQITQMPQHFKITIHPWAEQDIKRQKSSP